MKLLHPAIATSLAISLANLLLPSQFVMASDGHDHDDAAPAAAGPALPRFAANSELFELVGVVNGRQITLYLDRMADNSPVTEAQIELEMAGQKYKAAKHGIDEFEVVLPEAPKPGVLPITATVRAGNDADLLAADLDIHEAAHSAEPPHSHAWKEYAGWAAGGLAALAVVAMAGRRARAARQVRVGGAA